MAASAKARAAQRRALRSLQALFSIALACAVTAGIAYRIVGLHRAAVAPVFVSSAPDACAFKANDATYGAFSRLEQPITVPYLGFSIDWQVGRARGSREPQSA